MEVRPPAGGSRFRSLLQMLRQPGVIKQVLSRPRFYLKRQFSSARRQLFNLREDPAELQNVAAEHPEKVEYFEQRLEEWRQQCADRWDRFPEQQSQPDVDPDTRDHLRALGYTE